jgi:hypothetical protein
MVLIKSRMLLSAIEARAGAGLEASLQTKDNSKLTPFRGRGSRLLIIIVLLSYFCCNKLKQHIFVI